MIYQANISTPANTAQTLMQRTTIHVTRGLVYKVEFYFPAGSAGLMGVAVFDGLFQVWPSTVGTFFIGEDLVIAFDDMYLKEAAPFEFHCYTYNLDDTYDHAVSVRIGFVSREVFLARFLPTRGKEDLDELVLKMIAAKAERAQRQKARLPATPFKWMLKGEGVT